MTGTMGEEAIIEGRKRVNDDKDARPAKRAIVEGNLVTGGDKAEGEEEEEEELKGKLDRLRGLLEDNPKKLGDKDAEDVIRYLDVDEIISLAMKSDEGKESEQCGVAEVENWTEEEGDCEKEPDIVSSVLCHIMYVKSTDLRLIYEKLSLKAFTRLLLVVLDSGSIRRSGPGKPVVEVEGRDMIPKLCCVLPWKLLVHVLDVKDWVAIYYDEGDEEEEEETLVQKEAAEKCDVCLGKGRHTGSLGEYCSFMDSIPYGATVGSNYSIVCSNCGLTEEFEKTFKGCYDCGDFVVAKAVVPSDSLSDSSNSSN